MSGNYNILSKKFWLACLMLLALVPIANRSQAQQNYQQVRQSAMYITMLSGYYTWPNEDSINVYTIGVYGYTAPEYGCLDTMSRGGASISGKNKKFEVIHFRKVKDVTPTDILFINPNYSNDLPAIDGKLNGAHTLVFTSNIERDSKLLRYTMLNLDLNNKDKNNKFQVNDEKARSCGFQISEKLLMAGGTSLAMSNVIYGKDKELQEKEQRIKELTDQIKKQNDEINAQMRINDQKKRQNDATTIELNQLSYIIDSSKALADELRKRGILLSHNLKENQEKINEQEILIKEKEAEYNESIKDLNHQKERNDSLLAHIKEQQEVLDQQNASLHTQDRFLLFAGIFTIIIIILVIITTISNISRKKKNRQLELINDEVDRQKDHIQAQSEQLLQYNKELEKLSIVASQTDNGVVIMDNLGNIEWVNRGFTNLYGFTTQDLKNDSRDSLTGFYSNNPDIQSIKEECLATSESRVYECEIINKQGKSIWVQTTLTPILDDNNEIGRLVTIDTDITQIKEQELAIMEQGKTLASQRDELAEQNEFIKEQNAHISTSLTYAKTIQDTVMPLEVNITKYFKYFGIFIPLQIVSGDFYWYTRIPDDPRVAFTAAVDCTGHGVPGAFMCMITTRILSEIIVEHKIYDTQMILEHLNTGLVAALKQDETDNNDSLEICLCRFTHLDDENYELSFTGAKRPLFIYHDETKQFDILKGDRKTIGGIMSKRNSTQFTKEVVILRKNDKVYMTSDGFMNQFDENNKKYGTEKFVQLLKSISSMELADQKIVLEQEYDKHRGSAEQNDDVTIFAVQLI